MKAVLSWIRWKYVVPLVVFVATLLIFFIVFFDSLLAHQIEKYGSKMNGAKVEVSGLKTKFFQGRLSIARVQIADAQAPMQNTVEAGPLVFQLNVPALISRRFVIPEAALNGLAFNTPRKTSGALPRLAKKESASEKPGPASKLVEKYKDQFKLNIDGIKGDVKAKIDFDPKNLQVVKMSDELEKKAQGLPAAWEERTKKLNADERLKKIDEELKAIKATPTQGSEAITAVPAALKKLKETKNELDALKKDVQAAKTSASAELQDVKDGVRGLSQAKKKDMDDLMSRLNLDFASPDKIIEGLLGPLVLGRFQTVFHYVQMARERMPSKKEQEKTPARPRASGIDVEFPTPAAPPRFWLIKGELDGTYESIHAAGTLSNLTSDPPRVGKPFKIDLRGQQGPQTFILQSILDHTGETNKDSLAFQISGFDVKKVFPSGPESVGFSAGTGSAEVALSLIGEQDIGGQIKMEFSSLTFDEAALLSKVGIADAGASTGTDKLKVDFMRRIARSIESMKQVAVNAQVYGTWTNPSLKITTNLSPVVSGVLKDSVGDAVKDQRKQLEGRLDQILADKQKLLDGKASGLNGQMGQLSTLEGKIQQKINEATGINLGGGSKNSPFPGGKVPSLKGLFGK